MNDLPKAYSSLPAVDKLLDAPELAFYIQQFGKEIVIYAIRHTIEVFRNQIKYQNIVPEQSQIIHAIITKIELLTSRSLKKVINATGIIIHTNLGRAPFSEAFLNESFSALSGYNNLEFNLKTGNRGNRNEHAVELLRFITGAEDALVVNNCAAALMLCLRTFAKNKEVIVSRGELIEIGGSFRIPEIMAASDCKMVEVGTTNKTKPDDYRKAVTKKTALLLKAHKSNYVIKGFTQETSLEELVEIGKEFNLPVLYDQGSGLLRNIQHTPFANEPNIKSALSTGIDLICFSGDKLLGGPQAGIIAGKKKFIDKLKDEPMFRALRVCKTTLAMLETACSCYLDDSLLFEKNQIFRLISQTLDYIRYKANTLANILLQKQIPCEIIPSKGQIGGGSLPDVIIESYAIILKPDLKSQQKRAEYAQNIYYGLLQHKIPVVAILAKGKIMFDMLTIDEQNIHQVADTIADVHKTLF